MQDASYYWIDIALIYYNITQDTFVFNSFIKICVYCSKKQTLPRHIFWKRRRTGMGGVELNNGIQRKGQIWWACETGIS